MNIAVKATGFAVDGGAAGSKSSPSRTDLADLIIPRLEAKKSDLRRDFQTEGQVPSFYVDDILPTELAHSISAQYPANTDMVFKDSLRERKYVAAQMNLYAPILEEIIYAFQDPRILEIVADITGFKGLEPDSNLYAGGISAMPKGNYLKPHLDNSHDKDQARYRVLNLLYYVTPDWKEEYGGNLELWDKGPRGNPRVMFSKFNRLVVMATNRHSWHSVSEVRHDATRRCVSNYYFSKFSPDFGDYFHATSFRGRPEEPVRDAVLRVDAALRTTLLKTLGAKVFKNPHVYNRDAVPNAADGEPLPANTVELDKK